MHSHPYSCCPYPYPCRPPPHTHTFGYASSCNLGVLCLPHAAVCCPASLLTARNTPALMPTALSRLLVVRLMHPPPSRGVCRPLPFNHAHLECGHGLSPPLQAPPPPTHTHIHTQTKPQEKEPTCANAHCLEQAARGEADGQPSCDVGGNGGELVGQVVR